MRDRANHGLPPLLQSNNTAAQIHANELLQTKKDYISYVHGWF